MRVETEHLVSATIHLTEHEIRLLKDIIQNSAIPNEAPRHSDLRKELFELLKQALEN